MDGNRDESERCIKLAEEYIKLGLNEKAKKFIYKAERLYPSKQAKGMKLSNWEQWNHGDILYIHGFLSNKCDEYE